MRISFHIGPHKTGTTSMQKYLLTRFGSTHPTGLLWYPAPSRFGPGHADLAAMMAAPHFSDADSPLAKLVDDAATAGAEHLLLSAEDFIHCYPDRVSRYTHAFTGHDLRLISTQTSLLGRTSSLWQEMVKQGSAVALPDAVVEIFRHPAFNAKLLPTFAEVLRPTEIIIIYCNRSDPDHLLIQRLLAAMDVPNGDADMRGVEIRENVSLGLIEAELLRQMNLMLKTFTLGREPYLALRNTLLAAFNSGNWRAHCPMVKIEIPDEMTAPIRHRATEIAAAIDIMSQNHKVITLGDSGTLLA